MTPAQKAGIVKGKRYRAYGAASFADGTLVEIYRDDGDDAPLFRVVEGKCDFCHADGKPGAYIDIKNLEPEEEQQPMTQPDLMRQIADAMERDPEGWWREFQYGSINGDYWTPSGAEDLFSALRIGRAFRPKPRTYTLHIEGMPEPLRAPPKLGTVYYSIIPITGQIQRCMWDGLKSEKTGLDTGFFYPDEPTAREALEKLTRAMGNKEATWD